MMAHKILIILPLGKSNFKYYLPLYSRNPSSSYQCRVTPPAAQWTPTGQVNFMVVYIITEL